MRDLYIILYSHGYMSRWLKVLQIIYFFNCKDFICLYTISTKLLFLLQQCLHAAPIRPLRPTMTLDVPDVPMLHLHQSPTMARILREPVLRRSIGIPKA